MRRWLGTLPQGARVLDFASGSGRNTELAWSQRLSVLAVDRDDQAVAALRERTPPGADLQTRVTDLEGQPWPLTRGSFDAILVGNYLFRPRLALLADLLAPGGRLVYETFAQGQARFGRPTNPHFLLAPGELFEACRRAGLQVVAFEDGVLGDPPSSRVQRICAVRPPVDIDRFRLDGAVG